MLLFAQLSISHRKEVPKMTNQKQALTIFDELYSLRALRDTASHVAEHVRKSGDTAAYKVFTSQSAEYNRLSNLAVMRLFDLGYFAGRDETNHYVATLYHDGEAVAIWHSFGEVETLKS